jgi:biopolymer transport protein ExbD
MNIKKKRRISISIDMTPMVDIAFLLLIFYMTTTQFKPPEIKAVELPSSHSQIILPDRDVIKVTVTADDSIFVDYVIIDTVDNNGVDVPVPIRKYESATAESVGRIIIKARALNDRAFLVLKADRESSFGAMEAIMKTLQKLKQTRFQIITELEEEL